MTETSALERWAPIEARLRAVEETYRVERIRKNGRPEPGGEARRQFDSDLESTCRIYMETTAEHRAAMRAFFEWSYLLKRHLDQRIHFSGANGDRDEAIDSLRLALAAASLCNGGEWRDTYVRLGGAWVTLERAGVYPRPWFREAAEWSADSADQPGGFSVRRFLLDFERSTYFNVSVRPRLQEG
jgi:hypothetical protein